MACDGAQPSDHGENEAFRRQSSPCVDAGLAVAPPLPETPAIKARAAKAPLSAAVGEACSQQDAAERDIFLAIDAEPQNERLKQQHAKLPTDEEMQTQRALMMRFESLGDNCELGFAQRGYGAEPLSLLRWCNVPPGALLRALEARFAGLGEPQNLVLKPNRRGALDCSDTVFGLLGHAFVLADGADLDAIHTRECQRLQFLKAKLIDELEVGEKIFVYKRARSIPQAHIEMLFGAIRAYGPNTLLWVVVSDEQHPSGRVEVLRDGLLKGYISRMADQSAVPSTTLVGEWLEICAAAERIRGRSERRTQMPQSRSE
jgi:hypothetical protein